MAMFIVDAHQDLAYNALKFQRDLARPLEEIRRAEQAHPSSNGVATVALPEMRQAGVALVFGSVFLMPAFAPYPFVYHEATTYHDSADAHRKGLAQLDFYHRLVDQVPYLRLVGDLAGLEEVVASHGSDAPLLGIVPAMEGADAIREPAEAELWYEHGLRLVGLAWDDTHYAAGSWRNNGGLTPAGHELLTWLAQFRFIVDISHLSEHASLQTLDEYEGPVVATHCNARAIIDSPRHLSDTQIRLLGERDGMIGTVLYNRFLRPGHSKGEPKQLVTLAHVVAHIDHVCQVLGDARHVGLGSDFDGGFGAADIPGELDSVLDLPKIGEALRQRGYEEGDIAGIMGENWVRLLRRAWA